MSFSKLLDLLMFPGVESRYSEDCRSCPQGMKTKGQRVYRQSGNPFERSAGDGENFDFNSGRFFMNVYEVLKREHRLIENILRLLENEIILMDSNNSVDPFFIDIIADFIFIYADKNHHGKEEGIFFCELAKKNLSTYDRKLMELLVNEHFDQRRIVEDLVRAKNNYNDGDSESIEIIIESFSFLANYYSEHIRKEEQILFPNSENYLSVDERKKMFDLFLSFDRQMVHEKYSGLYESLIDRY